MRVRTLLLTGITLAFALVGARVIVLRDSAVELARLDRLQLGAQHITGVASGLTLLSHEVRQRSGPHALRAWHDGHTELTGRLAEHEPDASAIGLPVPELREIARSLPALLSGALAGTSEPLLVAMHHIGEGAFDLAERIADARRARLRSDMEASIATVVAFLTLVVLMAVTISRRVLRPIALLGAAAAAQRAGALDARSSYHAADEFGELSRGFDSMVATLQERSARLEAARGEIRSVFEAMPSPMGYWDTGLRNRMANRAHAQWFGVDPQALEGTHLRDLLGQVTFEAARPYAEAALRGQECRFLRIQPRPDGAGMRHARVHYVPDVVDGEVRGFYSLAHDVTREVEANERGAAALRENEALLATLRASEAFLDRTGRVAGVGGWTYDLRSGAIQWSGQTRRIHEVADDFVPDLASGIAFYAPEAQPVIEAAVRRCAEQGTPWDLELQMITARGRRIWARAVGEAEFEAGVVVRLFGTFQDITEAKQLQLRLADRERFLRDVTDGLPLRIAYVDATRRYRFVNAGHCDRFGMAREQIIGRTRAELTGRHDAGPEGCLDAALAGAPQRYELEESMHGSTRRIETRLIPDRRPDGCVVGVFATGLDVTERERTTTELRATSSLLRAVLDAASEVSIIATDKTGLIRVFNAGAERLLGWTAAEMVGRVSSMTLHSPDELAASARELSARLGREVAPEAALVERSMLGRPREWTYRRKDGSRVVVSLIVTAMSAADGWPGYLGIAHDVSAQKAIEASLHAAMDKERQASAAKSQFFANLSHEIRTPMNAVLGLAYLLGRSRLDAGQATSVARIETAGRTLLALIDDVLDLSKVEAGELTLEHAPFDLHELLDDIAAMARLQADAGGIRFVAERTPDLPRRLMGDANRLRQILTNLAHNAVKFTPVGSVTLRACCIGSAAGADAGAARLRFEVQDSGIGIEPQMQARLFAPFVQADASTTRRFGGTGLGLSIVKRLTELMGGRVYLTSTPGQGSEFAVEIGFERASEVSPRAVPAEPPDEHPTLVGVRLLVVDDSDINLDVARCVLELEGAQVTGAADGAEALRWLRERPQGFDAVLMDVQMPVLDGHEATRRIRAELGLRELPVIALTAGVLASERQRAEAAGMNAFVTKPIQPRTLVRALLATLAPAVRERAAAAGAALLRAASAADRPWPHIDGIDAADVAERLAGDTVLFRSMMMRFLAEFGALDMDDAAVDLPAWAHVLHKLRGSAGMLGARAIQHAALEAEDACRVADATEAARHVRRLAALIARLAERSAPVLEAIEAAQRNAAPPADRAPDAADLAELRRLMQARNLSALERFAALAPRLRYLLGDAPFEALRRDVENLEFDAALEVVAPLADPVRR